MHQEQLASARELHALGNAEYSASDTHRALALYEQALTQLQSSDNCSSQDHSALKLKVLSNLALCHISLRNYQVCVWLSRII